MPLAPAQVQLYQRIQTALARRRLKMLRVGQSPTINTLQATKTIAKP
jgi:hypothetical protein